MTKIKRLFTNTRVIIALILLVLALVAIHPNPWASGVTIRGVVPESAAAIAGIENTKPTSSPMSKERIISINNEPIKDMNDYHQAISNLKINRTIHIKTNKGLYQILTKEAFETIQLNETEKKKIVEEVFDNETNTTENITKTIIVNKTEQKSLGLEDIGLVVHDTPKTNIRKGLDLQGGTRVLLQSQEELSDEDMGLLIEGIKYRINVYGLSDVIVREAGDLSGNKYVLVEIAGAQEQEVKDLISQQGKFEAAINNITVFKGGNDITYVCRSAECSGIDPSTGCGQTSDGSWSCANRFSISLSPEAAGRFADATRNLGEIDENGRCKLDKQIIFYLDDADVSSLDIVCDLRGQVATEVMITGGGSGTTRDQAITNSLDNMKSMQTILITGSLPVKLEVVKSDTISPIFGAEFVKNSLFIGILAILAVTIVIFARYRKLKIAVPVFFTSIIEVTLLLGFAAIVGWNLDLAAIAGIIIVVGTGVDHQIVITDGVLSGKSEGSYDWKKRIKSAFFIIIAAYLTTVSAMMPLWFAGAGLLKLFALTTIIGVTIGILVTRPAYASVIEILMKE